MRISHFSLTQDLSMFQRSDYYYTLPPERIAQEAIHPHHDARLIVVEKAHGIIEHESTFWHLDELIPHDRVIFFNNSKVLPARIHLEKVPIRHPDGHESVIKNGEILFLQKESDELYEALVRPGNKFRIGTEISIENMILEVRDHTENGRIFRVKKWSIEDLMLHHGQLPLPPYIKYTKEKERDYQTVFWEKSGSVAAPTASLHFTPELLEKLPHEKHSLTLHVGLGTFKGIDTADVRDYRIHSERIEGDRALFDIIAKKRSGWKKILAIGTTVCRTLESLPAVWKDFSEGEKWYFCPDTRSYWNHLTKDISDTSYIQKRTPLDPRVSAFFFSTSIYLYPWWKFRVVDELITNFHIPESSLLVLVSAFLGYEPTRAIYAHALRENYRFLSFGDGIYIRSV